MKPTPLFVLACLVLVCLVICTLPAVAAPDHHHKKYRTHDSSAVPAAPTAPLTWPAQVALLRSRCDKSITPTMILRLSNKSSEILAEKGIRQSPFSVLVDVNKSIPAGINVGKHPQDIFAL